ncbi:MAG: hypothetical protein NZ899_09705 [Thermoguttaceae bacterium]|nr:hypothetical protein [Thermoguttaceae bacterium]MDW8077594.1 hypothetical protein [Thermoguttaceae bacterium]
MRCPSSCGDYLVPIGRVIILRLGVICGRAIEKPRVNGSFRRVEVFLQVFPAEDGSTLCA